MSGGSWDYVYHSFEEVADRLESETSPSRRALGSKVRLLSQAMHDIEWVDSYDMSPGAEEKSIQRVLNDGGRSILHIIAEDAKRAAQELIKCLEGTQEETKEKTE